MFLRCQQALREKETIKERDKEKDSQVRTQETAAEYTVASPGKNRSIDIAT